MEGSRWYIPYSGLEKSGSHWASHAEANGSSNPAPMADTLEVAEIKGRPLGGGRSVEAD